MRMIPPKCPLLWQLLTSVVCCSLWNVFTLCEAKTVVVSFDGFRWDYMHIYREQLPTFWKLAEEGVHVEQGLINAFITKTCPNHRTISTGMWEENHGMVANNFWAPDVNASFDFSKNNFSFWKEAEPFWTSAEKQNVTSVCLQFPGCAVKEQQATYTLGLPYSNDYSWKSIVDNMTLYFNKEQNPAQFAVLYYYEPDHTGHEHGPHSDEMRAKLVEVDGYLEYLLSKLSTEHDDVIITSDHGMASVSTDHVISIQGYLNESYYDHAFFSAYTEALLYSKNGFHDMLMQDVQHFINDHPNFTAYSRADIPEHWHYKYNERIPDILIVADYGWLLVDRQDSIDYLKGKNIIGQHGFDNLRLEMHPVFVARGPSFRKNFTLPPGQMESVDIYPLVGSIVGFATDKTNGSLSHVLPLLASSSGKTSSLTQLVPMYVVELGGSLLILLALCLVYSLFILVTGRDCCLRETEEASKKRMYLLPSDLDDEENDDQLFSLEEKEQASMPFLQKDRNKTRLTSQHS